MGIDHDHEKGEKVILGLTKLDEGGKRDAYLAVLREETAKGSEVPNLLVRQLPSKKPGQNGAVAFRQLLPAQILN
jgi:hypothetical protein